MEINEFFGSIAGLLTTVSFFPQVYKTFKTKSAKDLSLFMFGLFTLGIIFWLVYGILINSRPVIISNSITLVSSALILFYKIREMHKEKSINK